jgi:hypothetical protein
MAREGAGRDRTPRTGACTFVLSRFDLEVTARLKDVEALRPPHERAGIAQNDRLAAEVLNLT